MGGLKLGKKAGDGPKWWNHEDDSSAARRGAAQWCEGRVIRCEWGLSVGIVADSRAACATLRRPRAAVDYDYEKKRVAS
jgi:hypothetical protein